MRFQRRIKIAPGLRLNLSTSGIGFSAGPRGMSLSAGPRGMFSHVGLPGTGISHASKIKSASPKKNFQENITKTTYEITMKDDGTIVVLGPGGVPVLDESILRKIRRADNYKSAVADLSERLKRKFDEKTDEVVDLYMSSPAVENEEAWKSALSELKPAKYEARLFEKPLLSEDELRTELVYEAVNQVRTWKFWQAKRLRAEYVESQLPSRMQEHNEVWTKEKNSFELAEQKIKVEKDAEFAKTYAYAKEQLQLALIGDQEYLRECMEDLFGGMSMPFDFSVDYEIEGNRIGIDLDLPEIEDMPIQKASILASGKVKVADKSQKEQRNDYLRCILGLGYYIAAGVFNISPRIESVLISAYTQRPNKSTGQIIDDYVYSVIFSRDTFSQLNLQKLDPISGIANFEHRMKVSNSFEIASIAPMSTTQMQS